MKVSIKDILIKESIPFPGEGEHLEFEGGDGQVVALSFEELVDGKTYLEEREGMYRLVIPTDTHRRRWCKDIVKIRKVKDG